MLPTFFLSVLPIFLSQCFCCGGEVVTRKKKHAKSQTRLTKQNFSLNIRHYSETLHRSEYSPQLESSLHGLGCGGQPTNAIAIRSLVSTIGRSHGSVSTVMSSAYKKESITVVASLFISFTRTTPVGPHQLDPTLPTQHRSGAKAGDRLVTRRLQLLRTLWAWDAEHL